MSPREPINKNETRQKTVGNLKNIFKYIACQMKEPDHSLRYYVDDKEHLNWPKKCFPKINDLREEEGGSLFYNFK